MSIFNPQPTNAWLLALFKNKVITDVIVAVNTHLTADLFCVSLTINAGITLFTDNYRIYCLNSFLNNGTVSNVGAHGAVGTALAFGAGGVNPANHTFRGGTVGGDGAINGAVGNNGGNQSVSYAGAGGAGGAGGAFAGGLGGTVSPHSTAISYWSAQLFLYDINACRNSSLVQFRPGAGGGGGGSAVGAEGSGGGGAGGGAIAIVSNLFINNGTILVTGGNGGNASPTSALPAGGGGAGGGGCIFLAFLSGSAGVTDRSAGAIGNGAGGGNNGLNGADGFIITQTQLP